MILRILLLLGLDVILKNGKMSHATKVIILYVILDQQEAL